MKADRLYPITVYLPKRGKTPSDVLSNLFEASVRTLRRDVDALCRSSIPVVAEPCACGGYSLSDPFRLNAQAMHDTDYTFILTALHGLPTTFDSPAVGKTAEKLRALPGGSASDDLILDFCAKPTARCCKRPFGKSARCGSPTPTPSTKRVRT